MGRASAIVGSAIFFVVAPCMLAGLVPWWISGWRFQPSFFGLEPLRVLGGVLIAAGLPGLVDSFARFAIEGLGTPAPIAPPRKLVVTGLYRRVRNPMYVSIVAIIFGQALLFGERDLIAYGAFFWLASHLFVVGYEEPALKQAFGGEYDDFRANVPRWIPRVRAWRG